MKRFTLLFFAAVAALCSMAQTVGEHGELIGQYGAIYQMPEGAPVKTYSLMGTKAVYEDADEEQGTAAGVYTLDVVRTIEIVEFEDGTMFFKDLVTDAAYGSYVKGKRVVDEEDETEMVYIPVGQVLCHDKNSGCNIIFMRFNFVDDGEVQDVVNCTDDLVFSVTKNGDSEILTQLNDQLYYTFYGAMLDSDAQDIVAIGDAATTMTYNSSTGENDEMLVMPAGVATKTYNCHAYSYAQSSAYDTDKYVDYDVEVARVGDDVYIKGLYFYQNADAINPISNVVKGKYVDGEVIFPQHQYIGVDGRGADIYVVAMGCTADGYFFEERDSWSLIYDPEHDTYDGGDSIVRFNPIPFYKTNVYAYESIDEIFISPKGSEGLDTVLAPANDSSVYDLQGRKVNFAQKGLFIQNGKKVVR